MLSPSLPSVRPSTLRTLTLALLAVAGATLHAQTASPASDGFDPNANGIVNTLAIQPDGKIVLGGYFTALQPDGYAPSAHAYIARVNHDGTVDGSFTPNTNGVVRYLILQPNGQIIIAGDFTTVQGSGGGAAVAYGHVARLNADGSLDSTFNPTTNGAVYGLALQPNGQVIIGGSFTSVQPAGTSSPVTRNHIARFNPDGSLDATFDPNTDRPVLSLAVETNGQIVVGGGFSSFQPNGASTATTRNCVARLNADGTLDKGFDPNANGSVMAIVPLPNGQVLIGGQFTQFLPDGDTSPIQCDFLARLNGDGTIDQSYIINPLASVNAIAVQNDGKVLIGGSFTQVYAENSLSATPVQYAARINTNGSVDTTFTPTPNSTVNAIAVQSDGSVILGGYFNRFPTTSSIGDTVQRNFIARVNSMGAVDSTLAPDNAGTVTVSAALPNGQVVVGGSFLSIGGVSRAYIARLNADGSLDTTFAPTLDGQVESIAVQSNGQVIVGGAFTHADGIVRNYICRLNTDGSVDGPFNPDPNAAVSLIVIQSNGQILLSGGFTEMAPDGVSTPYLVSNFARINSDGSLDVAFNPAPTGTVNAIAFQSDGKMVVGGAFTQIAGFARSYMARLLPSGAIDPGPFDPEPNEPVYAVAVQTDGKVLMGGAFTAVIPQTGTLGTSTTVTMPYGGTQTYPAPGTSAQVPIYINHLARLNTDGTLDTTFFPDPSDTVLALTIESDGKYVVGGAFTSFAQNGNPTGTLCNYIGRVNTDGSLDTSFNPDTNGPVTVVSLLSNGNFLIAGDFTALQPNGAAATIAATHLAILNPNGTVNTGFSLGSGVAAIGQVDALALEPDGRLIVGGSFSPFSGLPGSYIGRFNPDGETDSVYNPFLDGPVYSISVQPSGATTSQATSYGVWLESTGVIRHLYSAASNGQVVTVAVQPDGKVLLGGIFTNFAGNAGLQNLVRLNTDGTIDSTFTPSPDGEVESILIQADGKIVIGGSFQHVSNIPLSNMARINTDGTVDSTFDPSPDLDVASIAQQSDGKLLIGGNFTAVQSDNTTTIQVRDYLARINTDGTCDTSFNPDPNGEVDSIIVLSTGEILISGAFSTLTPNLGTAVNINGLAKLKTDGTVETAFNPNPNATVTVMALLPNGQLLVGGGFTGFEPNATGSEISENYLARINTDGTIDTAFSPDPNGAITTIAVQPDGQVVVGGGFNQFLPDGAIYPVIRDFIARLKPDGTVDATFDPGVNTTVNSVQILPDGSIFAAGPFTAIQTGGAIYVGGNFNTVAGVLAPHLVRLNADSTLDATFTANPDGPVTVIVPQTNGGTLVGGTFSHVASTPESNFARLNADSSLDTTFSAPTNGQVNAIATQPDGRIVIGGAFSTVGGQPVTFLARLSASGAPDASFAPAINGTVNAVTVQANGQIVIGGNFTSVAGQPVGYVARLNADGSLDTSFTPNANGTVNAVTLQTDGTILVGGAFTSIGGHAIPYAARLDSDGTVDTTFDPAPNAPVAAILVQTDGKVVLGGGFTQAGGLFRYELARFSVPNQVTELLTSSAGGTAVSWTRAGGAPALASATFEESLDGSNWTTPVQATTADGVTWTATGLPSIGGSQFEIRARGVVPTAQYGSSGLIETIVSQDTGTAPSITSPAQVTAYSGSAFNFAVAGTQQPTLFTATGLPPGLTINASSGVISGTATGAGTYQVSVSVGNNSGTVTSTLTIVVAASGSPTFTPPPGSSSNRLLNLSSRAELSPGTVLVAGFVVGGSGNKALLVRAVGPGLASFNVPGVMPNPLLQIYSGSGTLVASNQGWGTAPVSDTLPAGFTVRQATATDMANAGAFPLTAGSADSAFVVSAPSGAYTLHVYDPTGGSGVVLAELYDVSGIPLTDAAKLVNVSARGEVSPGAGALIGGFVITGNSQKSVLIRGVGPGLAAYGVSGWLADPVLTVYDSSGNVLATNAAWGTQTVSSSYQPAIGSADIVAQDSDVGAFALVVGSADTALIVNLPAGAYTFQVTSASNAQGQALGEVYEIP